MTILYKNRTRKIFYNLVGICVLLFSTGAFAQLGDDNKEYTGHERAVFAFFRLNNTSPDYEEWVKSSDAYPYIPRARRNEYIVKESVRLGSGFGMYNLDYDPLVIKIPVDAKLIFEENENLYFFTTSLPTLGKGDIPAFYFTYGKERITLVASDLRSFLKIPLTQTQYDSLLKKVEKSNEYFHATLNLHIRPTEADHKGAFVSDDGSTAWLMAGKIAYAKAELDLYPGNGEDSLLWDYVAPWYQEIFDEKNTPEEEKYPHPYDLFKDK